MGRYVISLCVSALLVGFGILLFSLGMTGSTVSQTESIPANAPAIQFSDGASPNKPSRKPRVIDGYPPPELPEITDPYGTPAPPEMTVPEPTWSPDESGFEPDIPGYESTIESRLPEYPKSCLMNAAATERVLVSFDVSAKGTVLNASVVSSSNSCFNAAALRAIKKWRFRQGNPAAGQRKLFIFSLDE